MVLDLPTTPHPLALPHDRPPPLFTALIDIDLSLSLNLNLNSSLHTASQFNRAHRNRSWPLLKLADASSSASTSPITPPTATALAPLSRPHHPPTRPPPSLFSTLPHTHTHSPPFPFIFTHSQSSLCFHSPLSPSPPSLKRPPSSSPSPPSKRPRLSHHPTTSQLSTPTHGAARTPQPLRHLLPAPPPATATPPGISRPAGKKPLGSAQCFHRAVLFNWMRIRRGLPRRGPPSGPAAARQSQSPPPPPQTQTPSLSRALLAAPAPAPAPLPPLSQVLTSPVFTLAIPPSVTSETPLPPPPPSITSTPSPVTPPRTRHQPCSSSPTSDDDCAFPLAAMGAAYVDESSDDEESVFFSPGTGGDNAGSVSDDLGFF